MVEDDEPGMFVYRLVRDGRRQLGLVCTVDAAEYRDGRNPTPREDPTGQGGRPDPSPPGLEQPRRGCLPRVPGRR